MAESTEWQSWWTSNKSMVPEDIQFTVKAACALAWEASAIIERDKCAKAKRKLKEAQDA